jgi:D-alanyl-D-alanine carboxypeptidase/D-alanyl-D-alanine-endopeptidase (penicillin-binding protein 4)
MKQACHICVICRRFPGRTLPLRLRLTWPLLWLVLSIPWGSWALAAASLPDPVLGALATARIPPGAMGVWIQALDDTTPLLQHESERAFNPASTMKLVTTWTALEYLGPQWQWRTRIFSDQWPHGGQLQGPLYLQGGGDPALTLEAMWLLLRQLRARGITTLHGDLVLDSSYFDMPGSPGDGSFDDDPLSPSIVPPHALLINFNTVTALIRSDQQQVEARIDPPLAGLQLVNAIKLGHGSCEQWKRGVTHEYTTQGEGGVLRLAGEFPADCQGSFFRAPLPHDTYAAEIFRTLWRELGGQFYGKVRTGITPSTAIQLAEQRSPPLSEVIRPINKFSNNVQARQVFLTLGAHTPGKDTLFARASAVVHATLAARNLNMPELVLENGSGLSRQERISPAHLGAVLIQAWHGRYGPEFAASLPLAGMDGTLRKRLNPQGNGSRARLKTGTLKDVRALAGYVQDARGRMYALVGMINHPAASDGIPALDALVQWLQQQSTPAVSTRAGALATPSQ